MVFDGISSSFYDWIQGFFVPQLRGNCREKYAMIGRLALEGRLNGGALRTRYCMIDFPRHPAHLVCIKSAHKIHD
jgi:hypothetical protein